jgi:hypothetical protein
VFGQLTLTAGRVGLVEIPITNFASIALFAGNIGFAVTETGSSRASRIVLGFTNSIVGRTTRVTVAS